MPNNDKINIADILTDNDPLKGKIDISSILADDDPLKKKGNSPSNAGVGDAQLQEPERTKSPDAYMGSEKAPKLDLVKVLQDNLKGHQDKETKNPPTDIQHSKTNYSDVAQKYQWAGDKPVEIQEALPQNPPPEKIINAFEYIAKKGYRESTLGLTERLMTGKEPNDLSGYGGKPTVKNPNPNELEDAAAAMIGMFIYDAPMFVLTGGVGKLLATGGEQVAKKVILNAAEKATAKLVTSGVTEEAANKIAAKGVITNINKFKSLSSIFQTSTQLGAYAQAKDALEQAVKIKEKGGSFKDFNWGENLKEAGINGLLGGAIGGTSILGKEVKNAINENVTNKLLNKSLQTGRSVITGLAEAGIFTVGAPLMEGKNLKDITLKDYLQNVAMIGGAKLTGKLFSRSDNFKGGGGGDNTVNKNEFKVNLSSDEIKAIQQQEYKPIYESTIAEQQTKLKLPTTPETFISKETKSVFSDLQNNVPVVNDRIKKASSELYDEYKRLEQSKSTTKRQFTIKQIETKQSELESQITQLENTHNKQAETGDFLNIKSEKIIQELSDNPTKLQQIISNPDVPIVTKNKILWATNGIKPNKDSEITGLNKTDNHDETSTITVNNSEGDVIDKKEYTNTKEADADALTMQAKIQNEQNNKLSASLTTQERYNVTNELKKSGIDFNQLEHALNVSPELRSADELKLVDKRNELVKKQIDSRPSEENKAQQQPEAKKSEINPVQPVIMQGDKELTGTDHKDIKDFPDDETDDKTLEDKFDEINNIEEVENLGDDENETKQNKEAEDIKGPELTSTGIAQKYQEADAAFMNLPAPKRLEAGGISVEASIEMGKNAIRNGADPYLLGDNFLKEKDPNKRQVSPETQSVMRAQHDILQHEANVAKDNKSADAEKLQKKVFDFDEKYINPMSNVFSRLGFGFQGNNAIDPTTIAGLISAIKTEAGVEPISKDYAEAEELIKKVKERDDKIKELQKQLMKEDEKTYNKTGFKQRLHGKELIAEGADELATALRWRTMAYGTKKPDAIKALTKIGLGIIDEATEPLGNIYNEIKKYVKDKFGKDLPNDYKKEVEKAIASQLEKEKDPIEKATNTAIEKLEKEINKIKEKGITPKNKSLIDRENERLKQLKLEKAKLVQQIKNKDIKSKYVDKKDNNFTPEQSKEIRNYATKNYIDGNENYDYEDMITGVSKDLGLTSNQVRYAIASNKTQLKITREIYQQRYYKKNALQNNHAWIEAHKPLTAGKVVKTVARAFFWDKIFGHGTVAPQTHAGLQMFNPLTWHLYVPFVINTWRSAYFNIPRYEMRMEDLKKDPNYWLAQLAGLANNPDKIYDEYQGWNKFFGRIGQAGDRGFNELKPFRQELFNRMWNHASEMEKSDPQTAVELTRVANHATGYVKANIPSYMNIAMFAPRLEASRWAKLYEPIRALSIYGKMTKDYMTGKLTTTPSERAAARNILQNSASILATYGIGLGVNQLVLSMTNSKDKVNFTDPTKPDFLNYKIAGKNVGLTGGVQGSVRLIGTLYHISKSAFTNEKPAVVSKSAFTNKKPAVVSKRKNKFQQETPRDKEERALIKQIEYKESPFLSVVSDAVTGTDVMGKPLPYPYKVAPKYKDDKPYSWWEYGSEKFAPIPQEDAIQTVRQTMKDKGMSKTGIEQLLEGLEVIAIASAGARVSEYKEWNENSK